MKVISYEIIKNGVILYFDKEFYHIKYLLMTKECEAIHGELECDETEIKFTKQKKSITIYYNKCDLLVIYIKQVDNCEYNYSYFIKLVNKDQFMEQTLIESGLGFLFGSSSIGKSEEKIKDKQCSIKNGNIFANIKRKSNGNTKVN